MLHGCVLGSPHPHARILSRDVTRARALPGVKAVVTADDTGSYRIGPFVRDETVFATDMVRYVGDPVAPVAAVDRETAQAALRLIEIDANGRLTVWSSNQSVYRVQANVAEGLGLPMSKVRTISPRIGGG